MDSCLDFEVSRLAEPIDFEVSRLAEPIDFEVSRLAEPIDFEISLICTINTDKYLIVTPEVVWLNEDNDWSAVIEIKSNVEWIIE